MAKIVNIQYIVSNENNSNLKWGKQLSIQATTRQKVESFRIKNLKYQDLKPKGNRPLGKSVAIKLGGLKFQVLQAQNE